MIGLSTVSWVTLSKVWHCPDVLNWCLMNLSHLYRFWMTSILSLCLHIVCDAILVSYTASMSCFFLPPLGIRAWINSRKEKASSNSLSWKSLWNLKFNILSSPPSWKHKTLEMEASLSLEHKQSYYSYVNCNLKLTWVLVGDKRDVRYGKRLVVSV